MYLGRQVVLSGRRLLVHIHSTGQCCELIPRGDTSNAPSYGSLHFTFVHFLCISLWISATNK